MSQEKSNQSQHMERYQACFHSLTAKGEAAFVPFVTLGDPNPQVSAKILTTLIEAGADALELGLPFSDPLADGPTIQGANVRSLNAGTTPIDCFSMIKEVRQQYPDLPIGLLVYANLVFANGIDNFYAKCQDAGVDSVLIADVPILESKPYAQSAKAHGISPIFIAPPNADDKTLEQVSKAGAGYTYLLSRAGVTGAETKANMPITHLLEQLKAFDAPPALLGFGISEPEQVKAAIQSGAAGAISGSAVVKIIETNLDDTEQMLKELKTFISSMKAATLLK